ncbi:hypothetical protein TNCV_4489471 [Trichonephila clavipes]|nr:hypothetical protein TNCV_4489471 [Trichonephila clavipes]
MMDDNNEMAVTKANQEKFEAYKKGRIVQVFSGKTQTVQDMFGRGLLNLALGAELKSLPALKEGETFRVSTSQSGNGRFRCSVAVEIQKRARFPGRIPVVGGRWFWFELSNMDLCTVLLVMQK